MTDIWVLVTSTVSVEFVYLYLLSERFLVIFLVVDIWGLTLEHMTYWRIVVNKLGNSVMLLHLLILSSALLCCVEHGNASVTSSFIRSEFPSVDIPLDNEVFAVPKGHNAPQQVSFQYSWILQMSLNVYDECTMEP